MQDVMCVDDVYTLSIGIPRPWLGFWQVQSLRFFIAKGNDAAFPWN
jgi:hypothetical protein